MQNLWKNIPFKNKVEAGLVSTMQLILILKLNFRELKFMKDTIDHWFDTSPQSVTTANGERCGMFLVKDETLLAKAETQLVKKTIQAGARLVHCWRNLLCWWNNRGVDVPVYYIQDEFKAEVQLKNLNGYNDDADVVAVAVFFTLHYICHRVIINISNKGFRYVYISVHLYTMHGKHKSKAKRNEKLMVAKRLLIKSINETIKNIECKYQEGMEITNGR
jgi:hypothetical protein